MIFLVHSETDAATVRRNLGLAEYSYYFVLREFLPVLRRLGIVVPVRDPLRDVDAIHANAAQQGEECVFLSFSPPHRTPLGLACPTIPLYAWEFDSLPSDVWDDDPRNDWRFALRNLGRAITHSDFAVDTAHRALGADFPVVSIPAPVWDSFAGLYRSSRIGPVLGEGVELTVHGRVFDTRRIDLSVYASPARRLHGYAPLPPAAPGPARLWLDGVVYTTVLNPNDGRKNWQDMLAGFVWALRDETRATLILKLTHHDSNDAISALLEDLCKLTPFHCRVVLIDGFLSDADYQALVDVTTYAANSSYGEGQCLPLMEFMSAGKPAVTPDHTAMADYVRPTNAFLVASNPEPTHWPHDPRRLYRTLRRRIEFDTLVRAFHDSFQVAMRDPIRYRAMAEAAHLTMREHCSQSVTLHRLRSFLSLPAVRDLPQRADRIPAPDHAAPSYGTPAAAKQLTGLATG